MTLAQVIKSILAANPSFKVTGQWLNALISAWDLNEDLEGQSEVTRQVVKLHLQASNPKV